MGLDPDQEAPNPGQRRHHAGAGGEPDRASTEQGERRGEGRQGRGDPGGDLGDAEQPVAGGHAPVHEHRFVDGERVVVHRDDPVARLEHRPRDRREARFVLVPERHRGEADRQRHRRGHDDHHERVPQCRAAPIDRRCGRPFVVHRTSVADGVVHRGGAGGSHARGGSGLGAWGGSTAAARGPMTRRPGPKSGCSRAITP